jgi:NAD(P)-dependent dehydrogenase (short-subunit alcohol dehydrogenase family)
MKTLQEKVVVVTGAGSGMGREIALLSSKKGAVLVLADYNLKAAEETAQIILAQNGKCSVHQVDVSKLADIKRLVKETIDQHKAVDVLFNNAGIIPKFEHFETSSYEVMERMLAVNFWGVVYGSREFLPYLLKRPQAALVNTSSAAGLLGYLGMAPYVASKFAVRGFTETLRMEYWNSNLLVTLVHPGAIATNIMENSPYMSEEEKQKAKLKLQSEKEHIKLTSATDAAMQIVEGVLHNRKRIIIGKDAKLQDWLSRFFPVAHTKIFHHFLESQLSGLAK